jgi:glycosyltransferase involved in cell wall biosynthesis
MSTEVVRGCGERAVSTCGRGEPGQERTLLVFNCHEAWVYQLGYLGYKLDIIVGLKGRYKGGWDEQMRPVPAKARLINLTQALSSEIRYYCIIAQNIGDLLEIKSRTEPRLLVIHSTIEGRQIEEKAAVEPEQMRRKLCEYLDLIGGHAVAVSELKGKSWGLAEDIVPFCADVSEYAEFTGEQAWGLRICNFISSRRRILLWDLHERAFSGLPIRLVGHNPDMAGVRAAESWTDLKRMLRSHRFFVHTADPRLEDGYNMATLEAMAAGMPVLGNKHAGSPIEHGVSGFLSDDPEELRRYAQMLLGDRELAVRMGASARKTVQERFGPERFKASFERSIETARQTSLYGLTWV